MVQPTLLSIDIDIPEDAFTIVQKEVSNRKLTVKRTFNKRPFIWISVTIKNVTFFNI